MSGIPGSLLFSHPSLLIAIVGPTAVGKTFLSIELARHFQTEIISADSRQFYYEMKIGTAVPSEKELSLVRHHFIGHLSIHDTYNVFRYEREALDVLKTLFNRHRVVILTGGSGLYVNAVLQGIDDLPDPDPYLRQELKNRLMNGGIESLQNQLAILDPEYFARMDKKNPKRLLRALEVCLTTGLKYSTLRMNQPKLRNFNVLLIGLDMERDSLYERINHRVDQMIMNGLPEEARSLLPYRHLNALNTVGYKELFAYFDGNISADQAVKDIKTHTRKYAKRQLTWFRKDPAITWFHPDRLSDIEAFVNSRAGE